MARPRDCSNSTGWPLPDPDHLPTGNELVDEYVKPLANHPAIRPHVRYGARVEAVGRKDFDKVRTKGRDDQPFEIRLAGGETIEARAVIDASGTWRRPNPAGSGGIDAAGEREHRDRIAYGIPDVAGKERQRYAGKRILVVGSGHSAFNVVLDLLALAERGAGDADSSGRCGATTSSRCGAAARPMRSKRAANWASARSGPWNQDRSAS